MKKLILGTALGAAFVAIGLPPAIAFGPSPSDPHPPGALFESTPSGAAKNDPLGNMVNPPVDLRQRPAADSMRSSNVGLNTQRLHRGTAHHNRRGPEDSSTAPVR